MPGQQLTDDQFVEKLRAQEGSRKTVAMVSVSIGLALLGLAWIVTSTMFRHIVVNDLLPAGTTSDIVLTIEKMSYWWGVGVGFATALAWLLAVYFVFSGIHHSTQGRADRLLVELYEKANPPGKT